MWRRDLRTHSASARRASVRLTELDDDGKNDKAEQNSDKNTLLDPSTCGRLDIRFRSKMSYRGHAMCDSEWSQSQFPLAYSGPSNGALDGCLSSAVSLFSEEALEEMNLMHEEALQDGGTICSRFSPRRSISREHLEKAPSVTETTGRLQHRGFSRYSFAALRSLPLLGMPSINTVQDGDAKKPQRPAMLEIHEISCGRFPASAHKRGLGSILRKLIRNVTRMAYVALYLCSGSAL